MQKLTGDLVQKYTYDFKFQAYAPQRDGVYTQFSFMDEGIDEYVDFVNNYPLDALSFIYQFKSINIDLSCFKNLENIRSLGFKLDTAVGFSVPSKIWKKVELKYLSLLGDFAPSINFSDKLNSLTEGFLINYAVYLKIYNNLKFTPLMEVQGAPKEWLGEELGGFGNLKKLKLNSCGMNKLPESLAESPLEILILAGCKGLSNVDVLKKMKKLKYIQIFSCPKIIDYSFLTGMQQVRSVDVSKPIESLNLKELPALDFYQVHASKGKEHSFVRNDGEKFRQVGSKPLDELCALGVLSGT